MADEDKVIFDRKTANVLLEVARWWQSGNRPQAIKQPPRANRSMGTQLSLAEVVAADETTQEVTVKLLYGDVNTEAVTNYGDLTDGPTVDARNWMSPRGVTSDNVADGTVLPVLAVGQKVLVAYVNGAWGVVGILSGAFVDLLNPEDATNGVDNTPGILTTAAAVDAGRPYTYVLNTLESLLTAIVGNGPGTDPSGEYVLCVNAGSGDPIGSVFLTPLSSL